MPRYMVIRTFPNGLEIPATDAGATTCLNVVGTNAGSGVTWIHSYVSADHKKTYCIYDGPNEAAIRTAASGNNLPVDSVEPVSVLDPYFYHT